MSAYAKRNDRLWVTGFCVVWTIMAAGVVTATAEAKDYTATSLILVPMRQDSMASPDKLPRVQQEFTVYKNTQREFLRSPFVLAAALRKPDVKSLELVKRQSDPIVWLQKNLKVSFPGDAELMQVSLVGDDPKQVTALVRAVVDAYMSEIVNPEENKRRMKLADLERIYTDKDNECRAKRASMNGLAEQLSIPDKETLSLQRQASVQAWSEYRKELFRTQLELRRLIASQKAQQDAMKEQIEMLTREVDKRKSEVEQLGRSSVDIEMMRAELATLEATLKNIAAEREHLRIELRAPARIQLLQRAGGPTIASPAAEGEVGRPAQGPPKDRL